MREQRNDVTYTKVAVVVVVEERKKWREGVKGCFYLSAWRG
jgi:hypothetical protein